MLHKIRNAAIRVTFLLWVACLCSVAALWVDSLWRFRASFRIFDDASTVAAWESGYGRMMFLLLRFPEGRIDPALTIVGPGPITSDLVMVTWHSNRQYAAARELILSPLDPSTDVRSIGALQTKDGREMAISFWRLQFQYFLGDTLVGVNRTYDRLLWTKLVVPYWLITFVLLGVGSPFLLATVRGISRLNARRRIRKGCCGRCGYDLRATESRCSECGLETSAGHRNRRELV